MTNNQYVTCNLDDIVVGEPLPVSLYLFIDFRFLTYRAAGDCLDSDAYDRLLKRKMKSLFIRQEDMKPFHSWAGSFKMTTEQYSPELVHLKEDSHRKMMDLFLSQNPDKMISQALTSSKKMVLELMRMPYAVKSLAMLQSYSRGTVDHSINVSILSTYLAIQMGYTHSLILQHIGAGGLLHDIGKCCIPFSDNETPAELEKKMQNHPSLGVDLLSKQLGVSDEIKMVVAQHHEFYDGSGYPKKLRGKSIYDLARIVSIANSFDEIVGSEKGQLLDRQKAAIVQLETKLAHKFDPVKLEKSLKILKMGV